MVPKFSNHKKNMSFYVDANTRYENLPCVSGDYLKLKLFVL